VIGSTVTENIAPTQDLITVESTIPNTLEDLASANKYDFLGNLLI
jgi:hypothetical protein